MRFAPFTSVVWRAFLVATGSVVSIMVATTIWLGSMTHLQTFPPDGQTPASSPVDAIVVLGAGSYLGDRLNPCLVARVEQAAQLYRQGGAPLVIMSGGDDSKDPAINESTTMRAIGIANGIPADRILQEDRSTSTYENIVFSREILEEQDLRSIALVTEVYHNPRALMTARSNLPGITVLTAPTDQSPCWQRWGYGSRFFLREPVAFWYYLLTGKISLDSTI